MWGVNLSVELDRWIPNSLSWRREAVIPGLDSTGSWQDTFAFSAILFTMVFLLPGTPFPFKWKGMLIPTPTLFQVKIRFSCHATRQDSQKIRSFTLEWNPFHLNSQSWQVWGPTLLITLMWPCLSSFSLFSCVASAVSVKLECLSFYKHSLCAQ